MPAPPIYIFEGTTLLIFAAASDVSGYIEVPDVETGEYGPAFDSLARPLVLELPEPLFAPALGWKARLVAKVCGRPFEAVTIRLADDAKPHVDEMADLLEQSLGTSYDAHGAHSLDELASLAREDNGVFDYR